MPTSYLDTSALVKRHIVEPGHAWVHAVCDPTAGNLVVVSEVTLVEIAAAFARMVRVTTRRISPARRDRLIADLESWAVGRFCWAA